mgnify:CR=1 FL=1
MYHYVMNDPDYRDFLVYKKMKHHTNDLYEPFQNVSKDKDNISGDEFDQLEQKIDSSGMPKEALKKAKSELAKFKLMAPTSAEASVTRSYLDYLIGVPWKKKGKIKSDLKASFLLFS